MNRTKRLYFGALLTLAVSFIMVVNVALVQAAASKKDIEILDRSAKAFSSVVKDVKPLGTRMGRNSLIHSSLKI